MKALAISILLASAAATSAPVAVATAQDGATVTLTNEAGPCTGGARLAVWFSPDSKSRVTGCWKMTGGAVVVAFTDGESARIPIQALRQPTSL